ncbi:MAG: nucleoside recognition domain-containing protein [Myxococcaceae bacterium]
MLNWIFIALIVGATVIAAFTGTMSKVTEAGIASAKAAVELAIGLVGQMALWLGFMGILREAGLMRSIARALRPVMIRLFPEVPPEHPAMGAMIMNLAANMLGLGNAATPFGLKAMKELDTLNKHPGVATNSMALFLAINTSGVAVLALGAVAIRATLGSKDAGGIIVPSLLATMCSTTVAILVAKFTERLPRFAPGRYALAPEPGAAPVKAVDDQAAMAKAEEAAVSRPPASGARLLVGLAVTAAIVVAIARYVWTALSPASAFRALQVFSEDAAIEFAVYHGASATAAATPMGVVRTLFSDWLLPLLMLAIVVFGLGRRVKVYEVFVASAKEGFQIAITVIPFLVAILVAIGMFRASGGMEFLVSILAPATTAVGFPAEALPMALIRPLSGTGALGVMTETMRAHGPDSFIGYLVSVLNGSMETTFYVLAVYFGSVQVRALRHTVIACLAADAAGIVGATVVCHVFFG